MMRVLVVDDQESARQHLTGSLEFHMPDVSVVSAAEGQEAIGILMAEDVDVVITDLAMPVMDGFSLLAYIKRKHPNLPVIVATSLTLPEVTGALDAYGALPVLLKPLDAKRLVSEVKRVLAERSAGRLQGITLPSLLQLLAWERKSCSLLITAEQGKGRLHFLSGDLVNAYVFNPELEGEAAALEILAWDDVDIELERSYHNNKQLISTPLDHLILEAVRQKDEAEREPASSKAEELPRMANAVLSSLDTTLASGAGSVSPAPRVAKPLPEHEALRHSVIQMLDRVVQIEETMSELVQSAAVFLERQQRAWAAEQAFLARRENLERSHAQTLELVKQLVSALKQIEAQGEAEDDLPPDVVTEALTL